MAVIVLSHDVEDFTKWKPHYDADVARRTNAGFKELAIGTKSDDPHKVFMIWEGDPKILESMLNDADLEKLMKEAGVVSKPEVTVINT
jgi:hypothetical protein